VSSGHGDEADDTARRAGFWPTVRAVLWAMLGVRRRSDYHTDATSLDPKAVIIVGIACGVLFVLILVMVVRVVVSMAGT